MSAMLVRLDLPVSFFLLVMAVMLPSLSGSSTLYCAVVPTANNGDGAWPSFTSLSIVEVVSPNVNDPLGEILIPAWRTDNDGVFNIVSLWRRPLWKSSV